MRMGRWFVGLVVVAVWPSLASARRPRVVPAVFDPDDTDAVSSAWVPFASPHDPALVMSKQLPTAANAAAGAIVERVRGVRLDELGFDVWVHGHCGAGAPRFNVTTADGSVYFFGCAYGVHAAKPDARGFVRVRFGDGDAFAQLPTDPPWPGFGRARVRDIEIVFDEGTDVGSGTTALDDIDINGHLIGRGPRHAHDDGDDDDHDDDD